MSRKAPCSAPKVAVDAPQLAPGLLEVAAVRLARNYRGGLLLTSLILWTRNQDLGDRA